MLTKSDRTKQLIIEKAAHLFNTRGFYGTSMADIQQATGLAKGGIYGNFNSKEEIAIQAFDYAVKVVMDEISQKVRSKTTAPDKLKAIIDYHRNYSINPTIEGGCPLLNTSCDIDDTWPQMREQVAKAVDKMLQGLIRIIEKGKEKGEIKPDINASDVADIIFSQIEGAIMLGKISNNPKKLNLLLEHLKVYIDTSLKA